MDSGGFPKVSGPLLGVPIVSVGDPYSIVSVGDPYSAVSVGDSCSWHPPS